MGYTTDSSYLNRLYRDIKKRCKKRNYSLTLTVDQFKILALKNCNYCGAPPEVRKRKDNEFVQLATASIDRIDSSKGYDKENCVSCCIQCNYMKSNYSAEEFIKKCGEIYEFYTKKNKS